MEQVFNTEEIDDIVEDICSDYEENRGIDAVNIFNKPDVREVRTIVDNLFKIIFPGYFRDKTYKIYNPKHEIGVIIEDVFYHLNKQVYNALDFCKKRGTLTDEERRVESYRICKEFFKRIRTIRKYVEGDIEAAFEGDPAAGCFEEIMLAYPGIVASTTNRIAHELYLLMVPVIPRLMTEYAHSRTGIDIHPGATIGKNFFIDHGTGVVIGETAVIGDHVKLYQGVTLGALSTRAGQALSGVKRHPTIEDNVTIYSGASVLGGETVVGKNAVIGGNVFLTSSVPADTRVSVKNQELEYKSGSGSHKTEEIKQSEEWYYII
ncbi:MAG: serine acetyltransferase [Lachnospiraceae bacterium]|nr:serine acetyltransferase [Lachnospiraceae bacterium]